VTKHDKRIVIVGAGGHGREVLGIFLHPEEGRLDVGFCDDHCDTHGTYVDDKPVLGGDQWLCARKNQMLLLDALRRLDWDGLFRNTRVELAGGLSYHEYVEQLRREVDAKGLEDKVEFLGCRSDVHELTVEADVVVMPSKDEAMPNTVQEAMYIGVPVMASEARDIPEIVHHGEIGWVLPRDDPDQWSEQIRACIEDEGIRTRVGWAASTYAAEYLGTGGWRKRYANVLDYATGSRTSESKDDLV